MMQYDVIWLEVNLKTSFFQPKKLEKGLWFINSLYPGTNREFFEVWELDQDVSDEEFDEFILNNGLPVNIILTVEMKNPDEPDEILAYTEDIGWYYDLGSESMELIELKRINDIIQNYQGKAYLLIDEWFYQNTDEIIPERENNLVILTCVFDEEDDEEELVEE